MHPKGDSVDWAGAEGFPREGQFRNFSRQSPPFRPTRSPCVPSSIDETLAVRVREAVQGSKAHLSCGRERHGDGGSPGTGRLDGPTV